MSASEIQLVSETIALHPPVIVLTLCIFMYIRGRVLEEKSPQKVLPEVTSADS